MASVQPPPASGAHLRREAEGKQEGVRCQGACRQDGHPSVRRILLGLRGGEWRADTDRGGAAAGQGAIARASCTWDPDQRWAVSPFGPLQVFGREGGLENNDSNNTPPPPRILAHPE